jgi:hypothetical protein
MGKTVRLASGAVANVGWEAQPGPQTALLACPCFEVFFGGARGGGKTDGVLGDWISHSDKYGPNAIGLMVRRERTQLIETIERSRAIFTPLGATFLEQDKMWRMPGGGRLRFAYLERDQDADSYQGHSYTRVYIEEAGTFPDPSPINKLKATLRSGAGVPCGMRLTGNPGGPGHQWVKARYIDPAPAGMKVIEEPFKNPWTGEIVTRDRVFIPSKLQDNAYLGGDYVANLQMLGSDTLVRAWLEGDWSVVEGAFFDCWATNKHVLRPFSVPDHWTRFRSMDWGYAKPFSVGWWAVAMDAYDTGDRVIPRGALLRYREWYGSTGKPNVGLRMNADQVAMGILERETGEKIEYGVLDPAAFSEDGGPSLAEQMQKVTLGKRSLAWMPADNKRVPQRGAVGGWAEMRSRMTGEDGVPMLYVFTTCKDFIRTVPALQHDKSRAEDIDTESEDHAADEARYACMSRPYLPAAKKQPSDRYRGTSRRETSWMAA